jgi:hypothetical protein
MTVVARTCGSCTFCCKVMAIEELEKPDGTWCVHCAIGKGCKIYDDRPEVCRIFSCSWLAEPSLPEAMRPDRSKVVLVAWQPRVVTAYCDPADALAWRREPTYGLLKRAAGGGLAISARAGWRMWMIQAGTAPDLDLGRIDPRAQVRFDPLPGGGFTPVVLQ